MKRRLLTTLCAIFWTMALASASAQEAVDPAPAATPPLTAVPAGEAGSAGSPTLAAPAASLQLEQSTLAATVIAYQGFLTDAGGNPVTGTMPARLSIWNEDALGTKLWQEEHSIDVYQGYFTVELGRVTTFPRTLFDGTARWIQLEVNGEALQPRKELLSVPFSLHAANASALGEVPAALYYTRSLADDASKNSIDAAKLGGKKAGDYYDRFQLDAGYVPRGSANSISGEMIVDGSIQRADIGFSLGTGTITAVNPGNGLMGGGLSGSVSLALAAEFANGQAYDTRFVRRDESASVSGSMLRDGSVNSAKIADASIQPADLGFAMGTVTQVVAGTGLTGGGSSGPVTLSLNTNYQNGMAYDARFVRKGEESVVTSAMVRDGELTGADIKNNSLTQEDLAFNIGDITGVQTLNGITGGGLTGDLTLQLESTYRDGSAFDGRFIQKNQVGAITGTMILDGTIEARDLAFAAGDITSVTGINGVSTTSSGLSGDVVLKLDEGYASGSAFDGRFPNKNTPNSVTSYMIADGGIQEADLANNLLQPRHFNNSFTLEKAYTGGAVFKASNTAYTGSWGLEGSGLTIGVRGFSSTGTGVLGIGSLYGVHAKLEGTTSPSSYALFVEGRAVCTNGGWGDLAENLKGRETLAAGDVVVIDPSASHQLMRCRSAYDTRVAGIISTNPTIVVGTLISSGGYPLALSGVVPCKATAANGAIRPGDLLTSSDLEGHAMKAVEIRPGTIIGKALEGLEAGTGVIQVLATLH